MLHELVEEIVRHRVFAVFTRVVVVRQVVRTIVVEDDQLLVGVAFENVVLHLHFMRKKKLKNVGDFGHTQANKKGLRNCIYYNKVNMAPSLFRFSLYTQHANS